jgi:hypothetical protein
MRARAVAHSVAAMRLSLPRLAAAVGATAAALGAAAPAEGADAIYGGTAKGGAPIVVKTDAKSQALRSVVLSWEAPCSDGRFYDGGGELTPAEPVPGFSAGTRELLVTRNAKGRFDGAQRYGSDLGTSTSAVEVKISGTLKAKRAAGTLSAIVKIADKVSGAEITACQISGSWIATREPGTIYGGATSQGNPFVLRLATGGGRVNDVLTAWQAPCPGDAGYFGGPDHFVNFPVKSNGRFGNPFSDDFTRPDGSKGHYEFSVAGQLRKAKAKGTLQVKVTNTDAAGAATVCDSGHVTWKATTG